MAQGIGKGLGPRDRERTGRGRRQQHRTRREGGPVTTTTTTDSLAALCAEPSAPPSGAVSPSALAQPLFPPKDADAEARRRWLASSP